MSNRERWIVYPLLFYALVMGFKATYQDPLEFRCRTIECQQLNVRMINGTSVFAALSPRAPRAGANDLAAATEKTEPPAFAEGAAAMAAEASSDVAPPPDASSSDGSLLAGFHPPADGEAPADVTGQRRDRGAAARPSAPSAPAAGSQ